MTPTIELHAQPTPLHAAPKSPRLDRAKWHTPLISIVVTHHNYSHHVRDALLSILDQTYENWECVVVDDCSTSHHRIALAEIIKEIDCDKIRLLCLSENVGQTPAAFEGLSATTGEFVCILDPDDRYAETFLEDALAGHLNAMVFCPVLSTDQFLFTNDGLISGTYTGKNMRFMEIEAETSVIPDRLPVRLLHFPASNGGWHWGSTSSLMFRRSAMEYMRPPTALTWFRSVDSYLAQGAHSMGGTLFLTKPLVYRLIHSSNSYLVDRIFALNQDKGKYDGDTHSKKCLNDALDAIRANGGSKFLPVTKDKRLLARLRRSFHKRIDWLMADMHARGSSK